MLKEIIKKVAFSIPGVKKTYKQFFSKPPLDWSNKELYRENLLCSFERCFGYPLNLENPKTFSEKMYWLRANENTKIKTNLSDKCMVRQWVKEKIGEEYLIPLLGVYDSFDEINFDDFPKQFVIKCNHGGGYNIIVKDKSTFNKDEARQQIENWLQEEFAFLYGEYHYIGIERKILVEAYIENFDGDIYDYKYFCFNDKPYYILYIYGRETGILKNSFFDLEWNNMKFNYTGDLVTDEHVPCPKNIDIMNELALKLCQGFKHVRVDFYNINGKIYFGEMTFTSYGGNFNFNPKEWDAKLGQLLCLEDK